MIKIIKYDRNGNINNIFARSQFDYENVNSVVADIQSAHRFRVQLQVLVQWMATGFRLFGQLCFHLSENAVPGVFLLLRHTRAEGFGFVILFNTSCSMLRIQYFVFNTLCSMLFVQCFLFNASSSMLRVQCFSFNTSCSMLRVQCFAFNASCSML